MSRQENELTIHLYEPQQRAFHESTAGFRGFVGGRGSGKTVVGAVDMCIRALRERADYGIFAPTYGDLKDFTLRTFLDVCRPAVADCNMSGHPAVTLINGSQLLCRSLEDPESARGPSFRGVWIDEAGKVTEPAYQVTLGSLRYKGKMGWLTITTTPKGKEHWTYKEFGTGKHDHFLAQACSEDNPFLADEYSTMLRGTYTRAFAAQEVDGQFVNLEGALFKRDWFKIVRSAPTDLRRVCRFWDMAATPKTEDSPDPDWTAGVKLGFKDGQWFILDLKHERLTPAGNKDLLYSTMILDDASTMTRIEEEGGSSGKSLVDMYRRDVFIGRDFDGVRPTGDKMLRAQPFAAAAEAGNVFLVEAPWNKTLLDEMEVFSPECRHDDIVDACSGAMGAIRDKLGGNFISFMQAQSPLDNMIKKLDDTLRKTYEVIIDPAEKLEAARMLRNAGYQV